MNILPDKILVMADAETSAAISNSIKDIPGLEILEAPSEIKAFEMIYNHFFVLVIVDETLPHINISEIGTMLLSHKDTHDAPLLIITDKICPGKFLTDFKMLQIDYMIKPFDDRLMQAKINIFHDLFKQKTAVEQSVDELDKAYRKIIAQHDLVIKEAFSKKEINTHSTIAAHQMQQPLRNLQGNIYQLLRSKDTSLKNRSRLTSIKTAAERISQVTKNLLTFPVKSKKPDPENLAFSPVDQSYTVLYLVDSDEEFSIFFHFMKGVVKCDITHTKTLSQSIEAISNTRFDLIFIDHLLSDGTGFHLLSRLNRMRSDIPVVFTLNKQHMNEGPKALSKGAYSYFIKEEISSASILSIIYGTLQKAKISQEVEDAQNRIVMISRKDTLTKLYNRRCFEQALESETSKAKRYNTALSVLIIDFDHIKSVYENFGSDAGDTLLGTNAALIRTMVRNNDVICRYGQEEFGVVLPNTAINGARMLAERIRKKIADHEFIIDSNELKITVSIGIASYVSDTDTDDSALVKRALNALTSAMEKGNTIKAVIH